MRIAAYARYSSDKQRDASLEDQLRNCRTYAERMGWPAPTPYTDAAISGSREDRPAYRQLIADASARRIDVVLVDDLSRLSRDSVECTKVVRRFNFHGVQLIGVSDGVDTGRKSHKLDIGVRGVMAEVYLDDLAEKTHRGLTGRALAGASAGGLPYGYCTTGEKGQRAIDETQASIVRRIYAEYLAGRSPRDIAAGLNRDRIPSPRGGAWCASAVRGDRKRGLGILVNPIYAGRQVWNRSEWVRHPERRKCRIRRERPKSEWITTEHPELRIVELETFEAAQRRLERRSVAQAGKGRPRRYLLSGVLRCPCCGARMVMLDNRAYGCVARRERGTCTFRLRVPRKAAEDAILSATRAQLLSEAAFQQFAKAVREELAALAPNRDAARRRLADAERIRGNVLEAIRAGIISQSVKAALEAAERDVEAAEREIAAADRWTPQGFLPRAREVWQGLVATLANVAGQESEVREALRALIGDSIPLKLEGQSLVAELTPAMHMAVVAGARSVRYMHPVAVPIPLPGRRA
jgi:DNA invertase Pin-like site-specific DNA recombinase